jgi:hypothetical protein
LCSREITQDRPEIRPQKVYPQIQTDNKPSNISSNQVFNGFSPPTTDYNAELKRSNEQFRANMNRQAQDWNDYVRQKANRGW